MHSHAINTIVDDREDLKERLLEVLHRRHGTGNVQDHDTR